ncbi:hypothetical protein F5879DRAFT_433025 [Lentinula edodes]|nr:hypothetical protein F5879DRAFT_433025 [Lentinula edodes]
MSFQQLPTVQALAVYWHLTAILMYPRISRGSLPPPYAPPLYDCRSLASEEFHRHCDPSVDLLPPPASSLHHWHGRSLSKGASDSTLTKRSAKTFFEYAVRSDCRRALLFIPWLLG